MARSLPFIVQPKNKISKVRVGTKLSGEIEIEKRGYITVGEKAMVDQAMKDANATAGLRSLVSRIAEAENKEYRDVFNDLTAAESPEYLDFWVGEITESFRAIALEDVRRGMFQATSLLISRVDPDWTMEDTMQQHPDLVKALAEFYVKEDAPIIEAFGEESDSSGAEGKK